MGIGEGSAEEEASRLDREGESRRRVRVDDREEEAEDEFVGGAERRSSKVGRDCLGREGKERTGDVSRAKESGAMGADRWRMMDGIVCDGAAGGSFSATMAFFDRS